MRTTSEKYAIYLHELASGEYEEDDACRRLTIEAERRKSLKTFTDWCEAFADGMQPKDEIEALIFDLCRIYDYSSHKGKYFANTSGGLLNWPIEVKEDADGCRIKFGQWLLKPEMYEGKYRAIYAIVNGCKFFAADADDYPFLLKTLEMFEGLESENFDPVAVIRGLNRSQKKLLMEETGWARAYISNVANRKAVMAERNTEILKRFMQKHVW